jgi:tRNA A-37 threonylcarbamoyl transferase component Bud32
VLRQMYIVEEDQRLPVLQATPDLRVSRLTELVALVECFEQNLQKVSGRVVARLHVDDAVHKRAGPRMMCEMAKERSLADPGLAARFDRKACIERRERSVELDLATAQAANQPRAQENGSGSRTKVRPFGP